MLLAILLNILELISNHEIVSSTKKHTEECDH